jgi:hypothetical protein
VVLGAVGLAAVFSWLTRRREPVPADAA